MSSGNIVLVNGSGACTICRLLAALITPERIYEQSTSDDYRTVFNSHIHQISSKRPFLQLLRVLLKTGDRGPCILIRASELGLVELLDVRRY